MAPYFPKTTFSIYKSEPRVKIAIIGSGIAGLTASHLLQKKGHDVHLYESQAQVGMSAHTIDLISPEDRWSVWGDVPSRMFNGALWPSVMELYQSLGLEITAIDATQSYRRADEKSALQFQMPFQWSKEITKAAGSSLLAFAQSVGGGKGAAGDSSADSKKWHAFRGQRTIFLSEITRLRNQGLHDLKTLGTDVPFYQYLDRNRFSSEFREAFLFPALSSTVCTCSHDAIANYPAVILLNAMQHITGDQRLCRVEQGARLVSESLTENVNVNLSTPVKEVQQVRDEVTMTADGDRLTFDHVIVATQANQAASVCCKLPEIEATTLRGFQYENVEVVVHSDDRFMPSLKRQWAVFNFAASSESHESMCTIWMNQFHTNWRQEGVTQPIFQTIRPIHDVTSGKLIRKVNLQRPLVDCRSWNLWQQLREIHRQPNRRIWFCGSYAIPGIPLLESAVASAQEICNAITELGHQR